MPTAVDAPALIPTPYNLFPTPYNLQPFFEAQQAIELTLPISGKTAIIRRPIGRDMVEADRLAGPKANELTLKIALMSRIATIGGRVLPFEDFQEFDLEDITEMLERDFPSAPKPSPPEMPQPEY